MTPERFGYLAFMLLALGAFILARRVFLLREPIALSGLEKLTLGLSAFVGGTLAAKLPFAWNADAGFWSLATWSADGKTITTGLVGAYLSVEVVKCLLGIRVKTGDGFAIPLAAALAIGRWGCFFNGCCAGAESSLPWAVNFGDGVSRHPTQIYESLFHAVWFVLLIGISKRGWLRHQRLKLYLVAYCVFRFSIEYVRIEPIWWQGLTYYQIVVLAFAVFLVVQWIIDSRRIAKS